MEIERIVETAGFALIGLIIGAATVMLIELVSSGHITQEGIQVGAIIGFAFGLIIGPLINNPKV